MKALTFIGALIFQILKVEGAWIPEEFRKAYIVWHARMMGTNEINYLNSTQIEHQNLTLEIAKSTAQ